MRGLRIAAPNIRTSQYTHHDSPRPNVWDKMWHVWGKYYVTGNVNSRYPEVTKDNWTYGIYNQISTEANDGSYTAVTRDTIRLSQPMPYAPVTTHTAEEAYLLVLQQAGASLHRDSMPAPKDTDGDGMPDEWETAHGLNPNNATDGNTVQADGYTNLEHYLNKLIKQ